MNILRRWWSKPQTECNHGALVRASAALISLHIVEELLKRIDDELHKRETGRA